MSDPALYAEGLAVLGLGVAVAAATVAMTARFSRGGAIMESLAQRSFLPEKQRRYLAVVSTEGGSLLAAGIVWGFAAAGWIPDWLGDGALAILLSVGMVGVGLITWLGLRPSRLSVREQAVLRNRALYSLVLAPMAAERVERPAPSRR